MPFPEPTPAREWKLNTTTDKGKHFCSQCHDNMEDKRAHICTKSKVHSWDECVQHRGGYFGGHQEEKERRANEKKEWNDRRLAWEEAEHIKNAEDKKLWKWMEEDAKKKKSQKRKILKFQHTPSPTCSQPPNM